MRPSWIGRNLVFLFFLRGLRSLSQAYLNVLVPIYLARLGFSAVDLGFIFTASALSSAVLGGAVGLLSDRYGRKPLLVILSLLTAMGALIFTLSANFLVLLIGAAVSTIGRGGGAGSGGAWGPFYPAEQSLVAEEASPQERTTVFSALSFVGVLAGAVGSLLALLPAGLLQFLGIPLIEGDRALFALTVALGIAMALITLPVRERFRPVRPASGSRARRISMSPQTVNLVLRFAATNFTNGMAVGFLGPFVVYWFHLRYGVGTAELGVLFFVINLATAPGYLFSARLAHRLGSVKTVVATRTFSVAFLALMAVMPSYPLAAVLYLARMVAGTLALPVRQSYVMGVVEPEERATAAALSNLPSQLAGVGSPALAGYMMSTVSLNLPLELAAVLQGVNALLYYLFFRHISPPEEQVAIARDT